MAHQPSHCLPRLQCRDQAKQFALTPYLRAQNSPEENGNHAVTVTYLLSWGRIFNLEAMSDASMSEAQGRTNVREGILVNRRCAESLLANTWTPRFARGVATSTSTADLLAAAKDVDKITYFKISVCRKSPRHKQPSSYLTPEQYLTFV